jgi:SAM-dependent methyltransferase
MQILAAVRPGARVLDLGCSQGLLARPLREKGVRTTGVDVGTPEKVSRDLEAYHQRDLEEPLDIPEGRVFDYVVVADVIEHLKNREQLLRSARRYLKPDGRLLISTPNIAIWFYRLSLLAVASSTVRAACSTRRTSTSSRSRPYRREVEKGGFRILRQRETSLPFEILFESTGQSRLVASLSEALPPARADLPEDVRVPVPPRGRGDDAARPAADAGDAMTKSPARLARPRTLRPGARPPRADPPRVVRRPAVRDVTSDDGYYLHYMQAVQQAGSPRSRACSTSGTRRRPPGSTRRPRGSDSSSSRPCGRTRSARRSTPLQHLSFASHLALCVVNYAFARRHFGEPKAFFIGIIDRVLPRS